MPCQRCAEAAIMRRRQLEGMWSSVLAGSRRTLWVKSGGSCSSSSSTRALGASGAVLSSAPATPASAVGAQRGPVMMSPTAGGRAGVACPHRLHTLAPERGRPPQEGVEHVTRSMATKRPQVSLSTTEPVWWWVMCLMKPLALWNPCNSRLHGGHAGASTNTTVHNLDWRSGAPKPSHGSAAAECRDVKDRARLRTGTEALREHHQEVRHQEKASQRASRRASKWPGPVPESQGGQGWRRRE